MIGVSTKNQTDNVASDQAVKIMAGRSPRISNAMSKKVGDSGTPSCFAQTTELSRIALNAKEAVVPDVHHLAKKMTLQSISAIAGASTWTANKTY